MRLLFYFKMSQQLYYCQNFIKTGTSIPLWSDDTHYNPEDPTSSTGNKVGR